MSKLPAWFIYCTLGLLLLGGTCLAWVYTGLQATHSQIVTVTQEVNDLGMHLLDEQAFAEQKKQFEQIEKQQAEWFAAIPMRPDVQPPTPTEWTAQLKAKLQPLLDLADKRQVTVGEAFYFNFSHYKTNTPNRAYLPMLVDQLHITEALAETILNLGPAKITSWQRPIHDVPPGQRLQRKLSEIKEGTLSQHSYTAYPFYITLECSPDVVRQILTTLGKQRGLYVVESLLVKNSHRPQKTNSNSDTGDSAIASGTENVRVDLELYALSWRKGV